MKTLNETLFYDKIFNPEEYKKARKEAVIMERANYDLGKLIDEAKLFHNYLDKTKGKELLEVLILMKHDLGLLDVTPLVPKYLLGSRQPNYKHNDLLSKLYYDNLK